MSKIPFTLEAWFKDKSQKIETAFGEPAKIVFTEGLGEHPILAVIYDGDTTDSEWFTKDGKSYDGVYGLFLITPDEELTEFETRLLDWLSDDTGGEISMERMKELVKNRAAELLALARKQLIEEQYTSDPRRTNLYKLGKEEAEKYILNDPEYLLKAVRLKYPKTFDTFIFEDMSRAMNLGKAEALKDLPRWKKEDLGNPKVTSLIAGCLFHKGFYIGLKDLEKLPKEE